MKESSYRRTFNENLLFIAGPNLNVMLKMNSLILLVTICSDIVYNNICADKSKGHVHCPKKS